MATSTEEYDVGKGATLDLNVLNTFDVFGESPTNPLCFLISAQVKTEEIEVDMELPSSWNFTDPHGSMKLKGKPAATGAGGPLIPTISWPTGFDVKALDKISLTNTSSTTDATVEITIVGNG